MTFDPELVELFAGASNDRNPLHARGEYARATAYGEPVVFGVLAGLAVLARMRVPVRRLTMSFRQPVFAGQAYEVALGADRRRGELRRAGRPVLTVSVHDSGAADPVAGEPAMRAPMRAEPAVRTLDGLRAGLTVDGGYRTGGLAGLIARLGLEDGPLPAAHVAALLWSSYLVGMEVPGRQALFSRLTLDFLGDRMTGDGSYRAEVRRVDPRFRFVELAATLRSGGRSVAGAVIEAFVRPPVTPVEPAEVAAAVDALPRMDGRVAVVAGASRGLGAALTLALAYLGCEVVGCYRESVTTADRLARSAPRVRLVRGDAADEEFCARLAREVAARHGRVDLVVCSAGPPLRPLRLVEGAAGELADYVARAVRLVATPIGAFGPSLDATGGQVLVVSSRALSAPPVEWPHYVAAKGAVEHLVGALAPAHPKVRFLVGRAPRMDTAYVDTFADPVACPVTSPVSVAAELVGAVARPGPPGRVSVLEV